VVYVSLLPPPPLSFLLSLSNPPIPFPTFLFSSTNPFPPDAKARKIHYTCDLFFALSWGLITGFSSPFPWFYPVFFSAMIVHRAIRDVAKCREKYGDAWAEYERRVPWLFVPGVV
jgi:hypothetical protein